MLVLMVVPLLSLRLLVPPPPPVVACSFVAFPGGDLLPQLLASVELLTAIPQKWFINQRQRMRPGLRFSNDEFLLDRRSAMSASTSVRESPSWSRRQARPNEVRVRMPVRDESKPVKTAWATRGRSRELLIAVRTMLSTRISDFKNVRARSISVSVCVRNFVIGWGCCSCCGCCCSCSGCDCC